MKSWTDDGGAQAPRKAALAKLVARLKQSPLWRLETALIAGSILIGVGSAALSESNREATARELRERYQVVMVAAAERDLTVGTKLTPNTIRLVEALRGSVTANTVTEESLEQILGRNLLINLKAGDPLVHSAVEGSDAGGIASKIPAGRRLVTLAVKDRAAEKGWIRPNDRVDIVATMELPGRGRTTFTLLENVILVSVGRATAWGADGSATEATEVGFYAAPKDVEFISFAESRGTFSLALRNPKDVKTQDRPKNVGADGIDMNKFLDHTAVSKASGGGELPVHVEGE